ncbi:MAG: SEC-C domain-containing protein [Actinobacteria bacterium]|nr:SEC-C domain-containing protein [Actinomycetota bacterium]
MSKDSDPRGLADPLEAIRLDPVLVEPHEALVDEATWLGANVRAIEEGSEPYLRNLLFTLTGGFPTDDSKRWEPADVAALIVNPFYAIQLDPAHLKRTPTQTEDEWVAQNVSAIANLGAERWLLRLLANLMGDAKPAVRAVGRNDPCPCGSGRKHKRCHGR